VRLSRPVPAERGDVRTADAARRAETARGEGKRRAVTKDGARRGGRAEEARAGQERPRTAQPS
jgi:hypothetical protein